jgi:hypothetical protein
MQKVEGTPVTSHESPVTVPEEIMCFDYHERLAWIRRIEQMEKELKQAELAKAEGRRKKAEGQRAAPEKGVEEREPVPA